MDLWWELATLITIMILGHWIEMRSVFSGPGRAEGARQAPSRPVDKAQRQGHRRQGGRGGLRDTIRELTA
jgi:hypothetical protein